MQKNQLKAFDHLAPSAKIDSSTISRSYLLEEHDKIQSVRSLDRFIIKHLFRFGSYAMHS